MDEVNENLNRLLERLETGIEPSRNGDAIDAILAGAPRTTNARPLRDHKVVRRFRRELSDGLIRVDTVNQLLSLIRSAVEAALP